MESENISLAIRVIAWIQLGLGILFAIVMGNDFGFAYTIVWIVGSVVTCVLLLGFATIIEHLGNLVIHSSYQSNQQQKILVDLSRISKSVKNLESASEQKQELASAPAPAPVKTDSELDQTNNSAPAEKEKEAVINLDEIDTDPTNDVPFQTVVQIMNFFLYKYKVKPDSIKASTQEGYYIVLHKDFDRKIVKVDGNKVSEVSSDLT
ncbi:hypothetical protein [Evansella tamaricis]|uniref:Uncharacterized protein n=1 Tax=Evansella tamaricis TaxID=2069301 RepID=A0ABS6JI65_9BACI|nr:hypothetical protein [Evansella tamaricis]MBU9713223.1 hypothetical protein [Evansella tamaricis]